MAQNKWFPFGKAFPIVYILLVGLWSGSCWANQDKQEYIVYLGSLPSLVDYSASSHHINILQHVLKDKSSLNTSLVRSYTRSFNGFTAKLTKEEKEIISGMEGVVSVFPNKKMKLHTTRSWDFMSLPVTVHRNIPIERDVIIGVIDTGIIPELESFNDRGFGPVPKKWKGTCAGGSDFKCNKKLIGARYYTEDGTARDKEGHGTHTASTAAGNVVTNASFHGLAHGVARGGVPSARIAAYKVCLKNHCILAAFDDAIADGVDLITLSIGPTVAPENFTEDPSSIGAFHAMLSGILTTQSGGNDGRRLGIITSFAPWTLTVAASNIDRRIINKVVLGNGVPLMSASISPTESKNSPLIYGRDLASQHCDIESARTCSSKCWNPTLVKEKIIMCDNLEGLSSSNSDNGEEVTLTTLPVGLITPSTFKISIDVSLDDTESFPFPVASLSTLDYQLLRSYKTSTRSSATAKILKSEDIKGTLAPIVASFSSRGPNPMVPEILKPDISGPGVEILAAGEPTFKMMSGTSMSCPHVAGIVGYVKSFHPDWSPSAIKSALMTTAWPMDPTQVGNEEAELAYGSGHVDPTKALRPGLVYETFKEDYVAFLINLGYDKPLICQISGLHKNCHLNIHNLTSPMDLNYPSMMSGVDPWGKFRVRFPRWVTNVGHAKSIYKAKVDILGQNEYNVSIKVKPIQLKFHSLKQRQSFVVEAFVDKLPPGTIVSASLVWSDGVHRVRSPIVIYSFVSGLSHSFSF